MNAHQQRILHQSWLLVAPHADVFAGHCLDHLVAHDPAFGLVMMDADLDAHQRSLAHVLAVGVGELARVVAVVAESTGASAADAEVGAVVGPSPMGAALAWAVERTLAPRPCSMGVRHAWYAFGALLATAVARRALTRPVVGAAAGVADLRVLARAA